MANRVKNEGMRKFKRIRKIKNFISLALASPVARLELGLLLGLVMNLLYVTVNIISVFIYRSIWSFAVALYHLLYLSYIISNFTIISKILKRRE